MRSTILEHEAGSVRLVDVVDYGLGVEADCGRETHGFGCGDDVGGREKLMNSLGLGPEADLSHPVQVGGHALQHFLCLVKVFDWSRLEN
jgi:hypothetical protein